MALLNEAGFVFIILSLLKVLPEMFEVFRLAKILTEIWPIF
jgi:hypothetical protein